MGADHDLSTGVYSMPAVGMNKVLILENEINFTDNPVATTETFTIFNIPANVMVQSVWAYVSDADAQISDVDVGVDGGTADGFLDAMDPSSTGWKLTQDGAYSSGYTAASNFQIEGVVKTGATLNDATIKFFALCYDLR